MRELSARQVDVLRFIAKHVDAHGAPPTLREIGAELDIRSTNGVNDHLKALLRKGALTKHPMHARSLRLTEMAEELLGLREPPDALERAATRALRLLEVAIRTGKFSLPDARLTAASLRSAGVR